MTRLSLILVVVSLLGGCATMMETDDLRRRVVVLEARIMEAESQHSAQLEQSQAIIDDAVARANTDARAVRQDLASLGVKIDSMDRRIQIVEGKTEDVQSRAGSVNVTAERVAALEAELATLRGMVEAAQGATAFQALPDQDEGFDVTGSYRQALQAHNAGDYPAAREHFERILDESSDAQYLANALFWVAEGYYREENFIQALERYMQVIQDYPDSNRLCPALLKGGMSLEHLGENQKARVFFRQVVDRCDDSPQLEEARRRLEE